MRPQHTRALVLLSMLMLALSACSSATSAAATPTPVSNVAAIQRNLTEAGQANQRTAAAAGDIASMLSDGDDKGLATWEIVALVVLLVVVVGGIYLNRHRLARMIDKPPPPPA